MENLRDYTTLYCSICHSFVRVTILVFLQHEILIIHLHPSDEDQAQQKNRLTTEHPLAAKSVCTTVHNRLRSISSPVPTRFPNIFRTYNFWVFLWRENTNETCHFSNDCNFRLFDFGNEWWCGN